MKLFRNKQGEASQTVTTIIRVAAVLILGVVILNGIVESASLDAGEYASGRLSVTDNVTDGEGVNITISGTQYTFEFDTNLTASEITAGNIEVDVGIGTASAVGNLSDAINNNASLASLVTATNSTSITTITADDIGITGNAIQTTETINNASFAAATFTGGVNGDVFYNLEQAVVSNVSSGYTLAALMVLALGAAAIMRYMGFL